MPHGSAGALVRQPSRRLDQFTRTVGQP
jgi:hypothetical protein